MPLSKSDLAGYYDGNTHACVRDLYAYGPAPKTACGKIAPPTAEIEYKLTHQAGIYACVRYENAKVVCGEAYDLYRPNFFASDAFVYICIGLAIAAWLMSRLNSRVKVSTWFSSMFAVKLREETAKSLSEASFEILLDYNIPRDELDGTELNEPAKHQLYLHTTAFCLIELFSLYRSRFATQPSWANRGFFIRNVTRGFLRHDHQRTGVAGKWILDRTLPILDWIQAEQRLSGATPYTSSWRLIKAFDQSAEEDLVVEFIVGHTFLYKHVARNILDHKC
jgi:hypothetical protein